MDQLKMALGTEVHLGSGHIVLDGDSAPPERETGAPSAHVYFGQTTGWIKMLFRTEYGGRHRPMPRCVRWESNLTPKKGHSSPPKFRSISVVAKRSPTSAIAEHMSIFLTSVDKDFKFAT